MRERKLRCWVPSAAGCPSTTRPAEGSAARLPKHTRHHLEPTRETLALLLQPEYLRDYDLLATRRKLELRFLCGLEKSFFTIQLETKFTRTIKKFSRVVKRRL